MSSSEPRQRSPIFPGMADAAVQAQAVDWTRAPSFVALLRGADHVIEFANPGFLQLLGADDVVGRPLAELLPDDEGCRALLERVRRSGEALSVKGGRFGARYIDFIYQPLPAVAGQPGGVLIEGIDVTDRLLADQALRERGADLERQVIERSQARGQTWLLTPDLLSVVMPDGFFADVNPAWTTTLGWTEAEMKSRPYSSFVHPEDQPATAAGFERLLAGEPVLRFQNRYQAKDGSYCWLSWVAVPEGGRFYCTARDITAEKAAEQERDRLWALSEDMLARADYSGHMSAVNPAWTQVLGYSEHELLTHPYAEIIHPDNVGVTVAALQSMNQTGQPTRFENLILASNGEWKPIGWTVSPEPDGVHFIAVGRDLSDYKARERELMQAQAELRQSQKMEAVGQLTGGIAHDFNNLLAAISGSLQVLQVKLDRGMTDGVDRYLKMGQENVRRAAALTQRLLAFSRRQTLDPKPVDVNRLIVGMEDLIRRTVGPTVEVEVVGAGGLWTTIVDVSQLENSLLNLCINARDAMLPDGGRLTIATANQGLDERAAKERDLLPGPYISLCVTDTGTGMTPEVASRAFDPFYTTKPMGLGTGLGLSMVYGFVRQSGGQVHIDSEPGQGTTMCLYLPRHLGELPSDMPERQAGAVDTGDGETVLVIEDEATIRLLLIEVLQEAGYQVLSAEDGPSGLRILQADGRIDLLVTDVGLPGGLNGRQIADAARIKRPALKVLFITGYAENAAVGNGHLEPGMEVLTKPFDIEALVGKVRQMIER